MSKTVGHIVSQQLCISCGACTEVCKKNAITLVRKDGMYVPSIDSSLCNDCGLCSRVCPSSPIDIPTTYGKIDFQTESVDSRIVYSTNEEIRLAGTSGGVISQMLVHLLESGVYKQAFVLAENPAKGDLARLAKIESASQVLKAAKSKYVPASVEHVVRDIQNGSLADTIIVGTPCQFLAIQRAMQLYRKHFDNVLFLGLFCEQAFNYNVIDFYRYRYGDFSSIQFRDKQNGWWPGGTILEQDGQQKLIDRFVRTQLKEYFRAPRCRVCFDGLNQLADISFGDCYIPGEESMFGQSNIIIRTNTGRLAYELCSHLLVDKPTTLDAIKESQQYDSKLKNLKRGYEMGMYEMVPDQLLQTISLDENCEKEIERKLRLGAQSNFASIEKDIQSADRATLISPRKLRMEKIKRRIKNALRIVYNPNKAYKILIDCAGFVNRGDQLMLQATLQKARQYVPEAQLFVPRNVYKENPTFCRANKLYPLAEKECISKRLRKSIAYNNLLWRHEYVTPNQIDMVLDIAGFQFGDQWMQHTDSSDVEYRLNYYRQFSKPGCKIVFLSQAFGPFSNPLSVNMMNGVAEMATLIYAREKTSFEYLQQVVETKEKLRLAPDFTQVCASASHPILQLKEKSYVTIIPNSKMITHTPNDVSKHYIDCMVDICELLISRGVQIVLLNHEGEEDEELLRLINAKLSRPQLIVSNIDAPNIKHIIQHGKLTISSRYHGVVSSLTLGVPTLCTSWSHKYQELLNDHGCSDGIINPGDMKQTREKVLDAIAHPDKYATKEGCMEAINKQTEEMWREAFSYVK